MTSPADDAITPAELTPRAQAEAEVTPSALPGGVSRRVLTREIWLVLALSLGAAGLAAVISFVGVLTSAKTSSGQTAVIVGSRAPRRPCLDLTWQAFAVAPARVPVALFSHLMARGGDSLRTLGFDMRDN